ncbi:undecaprenyl-diphosphate phosphatase [Vallitalea okinawensis]
MNFVEILKAILFGIVEGITEWLPVSSTGHLILLNEFVALDATEEFWSLFEVVIQLGAIMAVVVLFWKQIFPFGKDDNHHPLTSQGVLSYVKADIFVLWFKILVACIPAAIAVFFGDKFEELFYNYHTVSAALIFFGVMFIIIENKHKAKTAKINSLTEITYRLAFIIGIFQLIAAIFPGTSRSGSTIVGALLFGVSRTVAAEFTFFLAIPAMFGASLLKLIKFGLSFTSTELIILLVGMITAFLVSVFVIQFLMTYIKRHDFKVFGWYRIALGILVLSVFAFR